MTGVYDAYASRLGYENVKLQMEEEMDRELFAEYVEVEPDSEKSERSFGPFEESLVWKRTNVFVRRRPAGISEKPMPFLRPSCLGCTCQRSRT